MNKSELFQQLHGKLIVSCQGNDKDGNPFYHPVDMQHMAQAAMAGGCVGFRANELANVKIIKQTFPNMIMIGIWKVVTDGCDVYITPTMKEVDVLREIGCEVIAVDGTNRVNCEGKKAYELIRQIKLKYPDQIVMADIATLHDAHCSTEAGADILSTTLSGYTEESLDRYPLGADFKLIKQIRQEIPDSFISAEGRLWSREDAFLALQSGANFIVVGTAITSPLGITRRFVDYLQTQQACKQKERGKN